MRLVKRGELNIAEGFCGPVDSGKSQLALRRLMARQAQLQCYAFACDVHGDLKRTLHDGTKVPLLRHANLESVNRALGKKETVSMIQALKVSNSDEVTKLIEFVKLVALRGLKRIDSSKEDEHGVAALVYIDEIGLWNEANRHSKLGPVALDWLTQRRHNHVGCYWGAQDVRFLNRMILSQSMRVTSFLQEHEDDRKHLQRGGFTRAMAEDLEFLGPHEHLTHIRGGKKNVQRRKMENKGTGGEPGRAEGA